MTDSTDVSPDRDAPISDHTDMTWRQLEELVKQMKADGRIPWA